MNMGGYYSALPAVRQRVRVSGVGCRVVVHIHLELRVVVVVVGCPIVGSVARARWRSPAKKTPVWFSSGFGEYMYPYLSIPAQPHPTNQNTTHHHMFARLSAAATRSIIRRVFGCYSSIRFDSLID